MTGNRQTTGGRERKDPSLAMDEGISLAPAADLDGDGKISPWESNLCRLCLLGALAIAFGDKIIT